LETSPQQSATAPSTVCLLLPAAALAPPGPAPARPGCPHRLRRARLPGGHLPLGAPNMTDEGHTASVSVVVLCHAAHALEVRVRAASITIAEAKLISHGGVPWVQPLTLHSTGLTSRQRSASGASVTTCSRVAWNHCATMWAQSRLTSSPQASEYHVPRSHVPAERRHPRSACSTIGFPPRRVSVATIPR